MEKKVGGNIWHKTSTRWIVMQKVLGKMKTRWGGLPLVNGQLEVSSNCQVGKLDKKLKCDSLPRYEAI